MVKVGNEAKLPIENCFHSPNLYRNQNNNEVLPNLVEIVI